MLFNAGDINSHLRRIVLMSGSDEGFYVLAIHALIEAYAGSLSADLELMEYFGDQMDALADWLNLRDPETGRLPAALYRIKQEHRATNDVRHRFGELSSEEARNATFNFLEFCDLVGWEGRQLTDLEESLKLWTGKKAPLERYRELRSLRLEYNTFRERHQALSQEVATSEDVRSQLELVKRDLARKQHEIGALKERSHARKEKGDELRRKLRMATDERDRLLEQAEQLKSKELYVSYLERFSAYTRTRADYERSVITLSPEQRNAAKRIAEQGDYLVHGPAGTGKTFVLLHALDQELTRRESHGDDAQIVLLTYTRTLVRFDEYLTRVVGKHELKPVISTLDSFVLDKLKLIAPGMRVDYSAVSNLAQEYVPDFMSPEELRIEIEDVVFGRALSYDDYVNGAVPRRGMKQPLSKNQREVVWDIAGRMRDRMTRRFAVSKNLASLLLVESLLTEESVRLKVSADRLFVDEVQDLSPVEIRLVGLLSKNGAVLAGDEQQAIYQAGSSFKRLGIDIVGHSSALKTNYRNTRQIALFAWFFQSQYTGQTDAELSDRLEAYREGPIPELWTRQSENELIEDLIHRVEFFIGVLGYAEENIGVITLFDRNVSEIRNRLAELGFETQDIREDGFDFRTSPGVRVSTLHSAKGVEFPVVLLHVPRLVLPTDVSETAARERNFNLVYVAITRALDNLQLFLTDTSDGTVLDALRNAHASLLTHQRSLDERDLSGDTE